MSGACAASSDAGVVRAVLGAVECNTHGFARQGYQALTGDPTFQAALTAILTIYVALVGYRMLFAPDGARLTDGPRMALKIGAVLALIGSWNLFEVLVFDLASRAPSEIAALIAPAGPDGKHGRPDPVGELQVAYDQLAASASAFAAEAAQDQQSPTATPAAAPAADQPPQASSSQQGDEAKADAADRKAAATALGNAAGAILTIHAGLVAATDLIIGLLTAIGPIFVILLLLQETRGFFEGWVRALVAAALASMCAWVLILLMASVLRPWLVELAVQRELKQLEPNTGMTAAGIVFVFTAAQLAMAAGAAVVAFGFRLRSPWRPAAAAAPVARGPQASAAAAPVTLISRPNLLADQLRRFDGLVAERTRAQATGAAAASLRVIPGSPTSPARTSEQAYRRSDFSRDRLTGRRAGR